MSTVQERPTRVQPTAPRTGAAGGTGVRPRDPESLAPGGPGQPPRPPKRTGGGGGGGGQDGPPGGPGEPNRRGLYTVVALATVLVIVVVAIGAFLVGGSSDDGGITGEAGTTVAESTPPAQPSAVPTGPTATPEADGQTDDGADATTPQGETGGVAVGGSGETGDGADAGDAEAEADAPLLTAEKVTKLEANQGGTVRFRVTSDTAQEVHVHGYDRKYDLAAGETKTIAFPASLTGIFEIEFEATGTQIGELRVDP